MSYTQEKRQQKENELSKEYGFTKKFIRENQKLFFLFGFHHVKKEYIEELIRLLINLNSLEDRYSEYKKLFEEGELYSSSTDYFIRFKDKEIGSGLIESLNGYQITVESIKSTKEKLSKIHRQIGKYLGWEPLVWFGEDSWEKLGMKTIWEETNG